MKQNDDTQLENIKAIGLYCSYLMLNSLVIYTTV